MYKSLKSLFCLFLTFISFAYGQSAGTLTQDLDSLNRILHRTPSFQQQYSPENLKAHDSLLERLKTESSAPLGQLAQLELLSRLLMPLNDNHFSLQTMHVRQFDPSRTTEAGYLEGFRNGTFFKTFPRTSEQLGTLRNRLQKNPATDVEGVYYSPDGKITMGLFRTAVADSLVGVVLDSQYPNWAPGMLLLKLKQRSPISYYAWYAIPVTMEFSYYPNERFQGQALKVSNWTKKRAETDHVNRNDPQPYALRRMASDIQYLLLKNFMADNASLERSKSFYESIKDSLNAPYLIVDLRNNGGGAYKSSGKFLQLLRKYANPGKIFLLANYATASNAEQFVIAAKKIPGVIVLGETTMGQVTYGWNYGHRYVLPSGKFRVMPTDLPGEPQHLAFETTGVAPDIFLDPARDWLAQVVKVIRTNPASQ